MTRLLRTLTLLATGIMIGATVFVILFPPVAS
jgi:hypothetical protein